MFDSQNKNFNSIKTQTDSMDIAALPLRTMEKDLKNMNDPNFSASDFMPEEESIAKKEIFESNLSEKQKTSPFLNSSQPKPLVEIQNNPSKTAAMVEKNVASQIGNEKERQFDLKKVAFFAGAIFIVLLGVATAYYFLMIRSTNTETKIPEVSSPVPFPPVENNTPLNSTPNTNETEQNAITEQEKINSDKPNFLIIDPQVKEKAAIQEIIKKKLEEVKAAEIYTPVEFVLTDKTFAPLNFQDFSKNIGLTFPAGITDNFKTTFSLFISNTEKDQMGIAILVDVKDIATLKALLAKEEPQLVKEADPLFLGKIYQTKGIPFLTNNYKQIEVRYHNIQLEGTMAFDYAILNNQLMIATSKSSALSLVDKILAE